jgi:hypothetical protein
LDYCSYVTPRDVSSDKVDQLLRRLTVVAKIEHNEWFGYQITYEQGNRFDMIEPLFDEDAKVKDPSFVNDE